MPNEQYGHVTLVGAGPGDAGLITVNGIGAKTALNILSSLNIPSFCSAVAAGDVRSLKKIL